MTDRQRDLAQGAVEGRAALILVNTASVDELKTRIGDLADPTSGWRHSAREILGLAAYRNGDLAGARTKASNPAEYPFSAAAYS